MGSEDISEGSREMVDLSAEAIGSLGVHLSQIGQIISKSVNPPKKGDKSTAVKVKEKLEKYKAYQDEVLRRRKDLEDKMDEDFKRLTAWRAQSGTEGASLVAELEQLYVKVRAQDKLIKRKEEEIEVEQGKVRTLIATVELKDRKWAALAEDYCKKLLKNQNEIKQRAATCSWLQCSFDEIRFKWKAAEEKEKLRIQHHQRMRKARAQARLDTIKREQMKRLLQACVLAFQEEAIESRAEKLMKELRTRHEDEMLIMQGQLAQALGDEEKSKELIAEQVRRMEEARRAQAEAERLAKLAQKEARDAKQALEKAEKQRDKANRLREEAEARELRAKQLMEEAQEEAAQAREAADASDQARIRAEMRQRKAEEQVRKKQKKIQSLQRMLAEIGAESDSDAPPDERAPAFFVNEDGTKVPRPRTRKERMGMAYREAESARYELRIGMAAMLDKDAMNEASIDSMKTELVNILGELQAVRRSNANLLAVNKEAFERAVKAEADAEQALSRAVLAEDNAAKAEAERRAAAPLAASPSRPSTSPPELEDTTGLTSAPLNQGPLAPSTAGVPTWSPNRPHFTAAPGESGSPRLLLKTKSTPVIMPPLHGLSSPPSGQMSPGRLTSLAPLRKLRKPPPDWRLSWH
eukprot:TRINITY_DN76431_c0_g1_i1.p1 TRINITY_DN76431_c0_g1~~TRINITY_DN76431_c0_g1_i1.p1  ORF type:complete len:637 (-),score=178.38 TRINITY_DN76431_c0_g1_i1:41-1951(-)